MENIKKINVRVYGLLIKEHKLMFLREMYAGQQLLKLPGGGLELGEGTQQTLKREFIEELNLNIDVKKHYYTQDFFIESKLTPDSQLLSIYYKVECKDFSTLKIKEKSIKEVVWTHIEELNIVKIPLPVDKIVIQQLINEKN